MKETLRAVLPYLRKYRRGLSSGVTVLVLRNVAAAGVPLLIGHAVDRLAAEFSLRLAVMMAAALIAITAIKGILQYAMRVILIGISRDIEYDLRNDLFGHLIRLSSDFYSRYRTGDIMARATNDLNSVRVMLGPGIMYTADTGLTALLAIIVMTSVDWKLTLLTLLPAPIVTVMVAYFGRYIHAQFKRIQELFGDISSRVQENLAGVRVIRAYVQEASEERLFRTLNEHYITENLKMARVSGLFMPALQSLTGISFLIVLWYGGLRLLDGEITLGTFLMFNVYVGMLVWPMVAMGWVVNLIQRGSASMARISAVLKETPGIADPAQPQRLAEPRRGEIKLENVTLELGDKRILNDLSIQIAGGSTVAVVGRTGSGKSSLVHLIPRLYDPTDGRVTLDGIDLRNLAVGELRREIGFVPQETFLFSATLAENIAFGVPEATEEQIRRAAESAGLADDVAGFPDGYQTIVGERGITLSGGQKQRTAIARAIIRDPRVLILDDALASVDTVTEERILTALESVMRDRTTIIISHRVSTVQNADQILVIDEGRVVEQGNHSQLLAADRYYASLYRKQLLEEELEAI